MPFIRGAREVPNQTPASTSDARKRQAEKDGPVSFDPLAGDVTPTVESSTITNTDLPPSLPDTSTWVRRELGEFVDAKTPLLLVSQSGEVVSFYPTGLWVRFKVGTTNAAYTPPPVEPSPWEGISTDPEHPTAGWVTFDGVTDPVLGEWWIESGYLHRHRDDKDWRYESVTHVEVLHTHAPETHVPVERAVVDEFREFLDSGGSVDRTPYEWRQFVSQFLAALADGAKSKGAES